MGRLLATTCCVAVLTLPGLAIEPPVAVSPASPEGIAAVASSCPTFSWAALDGARGYELVVYRVEAGAPVGEAVMEESLPRGASSWTPSAERCLEPGGTYAWVVRAVDEQAAGEWSAASLFTVRDWPSEAELEVALEALRRRRESREEPTAVGRRPPGPAGPGTAAVRPTAAGEDEAAGVSAKATTAPHFRVDGSGLVNASNLVVGSSATTSRRAVFADSEWNTAPVVIGSQGGQSDVGAALTLDSESSDSGRSFSLISTADGAAIGGQKLGIWDDTGSRYLVSIDGVNTEVRLRDLALTVTNRFAFVIGVSSFDVACNADEYLTGGGCVCSPTGKVVGSWPGDDNNWDCGCGDSFGGTAYAVCVKSTPP